MSNETFVISGAVSDGDFITNVIPPYWERFYISRTFFSDAAMTTSVTPSAGTMTVTATDDSFNYGSVVNGIVDATNGQYDRPTMSGRVVNFNVNLTGIIGASHFRVVVNAYN